MPHVEGRYNVSFSGLKTAVLNEVNQAQMKGADINVPDLAASFQERIAGILAEKLLLAAADTGAKQVCLAGGVAPMAVCASWSTTAPRSWGPGSTCPS